MRGPVHELGRVTANLFFCAGGSRGQAAALNPFVPDTPAAAEWAEGWESLWAESPSFTSEQAQPQAASWMKGGW